MQIFSNALAATPVSLQPQDTGSTTGTNASSSAAEANTATVTANDFLQLLVTELQNQDPTANTDPNEYIDQLVQVNSLEQLISINQDLAPLSSTSSGNGASSAWTPVGSENGRPGVPAGPGSATGTTSAGNLSAPPSGDSASRIAIAMETAAQTLAPVASASPLDSMLNLPAAQTRRATTITSNTAR
ncbi:MAG TPA: flagellar hook capping FlgD N-terminal domain-containing protein [Acidobacteriaceae bacterium]|nr:flagellar hook capping FlgD N-terminal domain-containing protein [Acidobacteriaceae bacterium]